MRVSLKKLTLSAMFLALALILPFLTMRIPQLGSMLLPMHIPVLLCGIICGWKYGLEVGLIAPLLNSVSFGRPPLLPTALAMAFELAAYGASIGLLYKKLPKNTGGLYAGLVSSMLIGRVVWGAVSIAIHSLMGSAFTGAVFASGAFIKAWPGILVQLILIPALILPLKKAKVMI